MLPVGSKFLLLAKGSLWMGNRSIPLIVAIVLSLTACTSENGPRVTREPARPASDQQTDPSLPRPLER